MAIRLRGPRVSVGPAARRLSAEVEEGQEGPEMTTIPWSPAEIERLLVDDVREMITCRAVGDLLRLDTPYVLQDGHMLQVWLESSNGAIQVSDGGWTLSQTDLFASSSTLRSQRARQVDAIARANGLQFDGDALTWRGDGLLLHVLTTYTGSDPSGASAIVLLACIRPSPVERRVRHAAPVSSPQPPALSPLPRPPDWQVEWAR